MKLPSSQPPAPFLQEPSTVRVDPVSGVMTGGNRRYEKRFADLKGIYQDEAAFARTLAERGQELSYEVYEHRPVGESAGDLIFGTSILYPGKIGEEYALTRGHIHARSDRPEVYLCQAGEGVMLMESPDGQSRSAPMSPQAIVYVPPYWIHRSVNVGRGPLVTVFCYPADSGQDYGIISRSGGVRTLVVDDGAGGWRETPNPRYRPRSGEEVARWFAAPAPPGTNP